MAPWPVFPPPPANATPHGQGPPPRPSLYGLGLLQPAPPPFAVNCCSSPDEPCELCLKRAKDYDDFYAAHLRIQQLIGPPPLPSTTIYCCSQPHLPCLSCSIRSLEYGNLYCAYTHMQQAAAVYRAQHDLVKAKSEHAHQYIHYMHTGNLPSRDSFPGRDIYRNLDEWLISDYKEKLEEAKRQLGASEDTVGSLKDELAEVKKQLQGSENTIKTLRGELFRARGGLF